MSYHHCEQNGRGAAPLRHRHLSGAPGVSAIAHTGERSLKCTKSVLSHQTDKITGFIWAFGPAGKHITSIVTNCVQLPSEEGGIPN